jgi:hypothetical protein
VFKMPNSFEEFQQKRLRVLQAQVDRGLVRHVLQFGLAIAASGVAGMVAYPFLHHQPVLSVFNWRELILIPVTAGITAALWNFYALRRQLTRLQPASPSPAPGTAP